MTSDRVKHFSSDLDVDDDDDVDDDVVDDDDDDKDVDDDDADGKIDDYLTPHKQSSNENGSGLMNFLFREAR